MTNYTHKIIEVATDTSSKSYTFTYPNAITVNGTVSDSNKVVTFGTINTPSYSSSWNKSGSTVKPSVTMSISVGSSKGFLGQALFYTVDSNGNVVDTIVLTFIVRHTNLTESKANALADLFELQQTTGGFLTKSVVLSEVNPQPFAYIQATPFGSSTLRGFIIDGEFDETTTGSSVYSNLGSSGTKRTISYLFAKTYTINVTTDYGSSVSGSYPDTVVEGSNKYLHISKRQGYKLTSVILDDSSQTIPSQTEASGEVMTISLENITSNHNLVVTSEPFKYTITTSAGSNGSITPSATVNYGSSKTINMSPSTGYEVNEVIVDGINKGKITTYTFNNITDNHTISVTFKKLDEQKFTVNCTTVQNGNISVSPTSATVGTKITIYVNPSEGYRLKQIDSSPVVAINNNQFTMPAQNVTLTPVFENIETQTYAITVGTSEHGTATASHTSASAGTTITMTATPGQGYVLKDYATQPYVSVVNGQFVMPSSPITVTPIFDIVSVVKTSYDIYVSTETTDKGDVSVTGVDETKGIISIKAEAEPGYRFSEWKISNGVSFLSSPYTSETLLIIQDSDVSVIAHFVKDILPTKVNQVHLTITK